MSILPKKFGPNQMAILTAIAPGPTREALSVVQLCIKVWNLSLAHERSSKADAPVLDPHSKMGNLFENGMKLAVGLICALRGVSAIRHLFYKVSISGGGVGGGRKRGKRTVSIQIRLI
jgi:hypothetical protein